MRKKILIFSIIFTFILVNITAVQANTGKIELKISNSTPKQGETFTVTVSVTCEDGINGIDTSFSYDTDTLELVSGSVTDSNWSSLGSGTDITIISNSTSKITTADVYVITFKVKNNAKVGNSININLAKALLDSDAQIDSEIIIPAQSVAVKVSSDEKEDNTTNTTNETNTNTTTINTNTIQSDNTTKSENTQNTIQSSNITSEKNDSTTSNNQLPKTGFVAFTGIYIIVLIALAIVIFRKIKKYDGID